MRPDDDGDFEADRRSERRQRREEAQRHFDFVKERHQVDGPVEIDGATHYEVWYWDEDLQRVGSQMRIIDIPHDKRFKTIFDLEVTNAIWHLSRVRKQELDAVARAQEEKRNA